MKKCPSCKYEISASAKTCPNCGKKFTSVVTKVIAVIFAIGLIGAIFGDKNPPSN